MKGLEAFKELKGVLAYFGAHTEKAIESCNIIEKELKEGEIAIDFANRVYDIIGGENDVDIIVETIESQKKALEIIKNKEVDIYGIKNSIDVYDYNAGIENEDNFENRMLTEEEYNLLKEVLL